MTDWEYGVAHVTRLYPTRHEAVGAAAVMGRSSRQGAEFWTELVEAFNPRYD